MREHLARNPMGHLGYQVTLNNRYQAVMGRLITFPVSQLESTHRLIVIQRAMQTNVHGKRFSNSIDYQTQISVLMDAYLAKRIGTGFYLAVLRFIASQAPTTTAKGLIDMCRRNMKRELAKRPVIKKRHLPS
ncbi:hypothetical protein VroAM7_48860 (plasmid) [Vibrio rotiferianus]|uniref:Uncharacterized protein n=1 Tax=Vibrio rotiferianus TaxID=190895 RepID=A0A510IET6_9VIBR|nr:hypothetical protein [Vibrio rotiferianus]BBL92233.1 hypothetical protein VroAM7_48860 [Vibrio rotiferianus]